MVLAFNSDDFALLIEQNIKLLSHIAEKQVF